MNEEQNRAEREYIEMEAARIDSSERYFDARPQIDNADRRKVFESGFDRGWQAAIASQAKNVLPNQEPLGSEFEKVLDEDLDSLYETSVATQPPTNDKEMINCHYEYISVDGSEESDAGVWPVLVPNGFKIVNDNQPADDRVLELEKDAARYHWLKDNYHGFAHYRSGVIPCVDLGQDIDRQIAFMKRASK